MKLKMDISYDFNIPISGITTTAVGIMKLGFWWETCRESFLPIIFYFNVMYYIIYNIISI